jgi:hypothetical protein
MTTPLSIPPQLSWGYLDHQCHFAIRYFDYLWGLFRRWRLPSFAHAAACIRFFAFARLDPALVSVKSTLAKIKDASYEGIIGRVRASYPIAYLYLFVSGPVQHL